MTAVFRKCLYQVMHQIKYYHFFTINVAQLLKLKNKGMLAQGMDVDIVVFNDNLLVNHVMAKGK